MIACDQLQVQEMLSASAAVQGPGMVASDHQILQSEQHYYFYASTAYAAP